MCEEDRISTRYIRCLMKREGLCMCEMELITKNGLPLSHTFNKKPINFFSDFLEFFTVYFLRSFVASFRISFHRTDAIDELLNGSFRAFLQSFDLIDLITQHLIILAKISEFTIIEASTQHLASTSRHTSLWAAGKAWKTQRRF